MRTSSLVAESVWQAIESTRLVTDDQLSILHFMYGKNLEKAMRIFDERGGVNRISGEPSGRSIFQENHGERKYTCALRNTIVLVIHSSMTLLTEEKNFVDGYENYPSGLGKFQKRFDHSRTNLKVGVVFCKHQLAARLAASTGSCIEVKVSDEELALLLSKL